MRYPSKDVEGILWLFFVWAKNVVGGKVGVRCTSTRFNKGKASHGNNKITDNTIDGKMLGILYLHWWRSAARLDRAESAAATHVCTEVHIKCVKSKYMPRCGGESIVFSDTFQSSKKSPGPCHLAVSSKAFSVHNRRTVLVVLSLADPHAREGAEAADNRPADPRGVLPIPKRDAFGDHSFWC